MATSMKKAVQWAVNIANNNKYTYGFGQPPRNISFGDYNGTKFDCSGFVSYALYHGGFYNDNQYPFSTYNEYNELQALGFNIVPYSQVGINNLKSGMIVWYSQGSGHQYGHTGIICGKNRLVEAYTDEVPKAQQIRVTDDIDRNWQWVAYTNDIDFDVGLWDAKSICALLGNTWYESHNNPQLEENLGQGGVAGYGVGLIQWSSLQSYQASWNMLQTKINNSGSPNTNLKQISSQLSAIEYELLVGDGSWFSKNGYNLTGEEFVKNSKNKSIDYLTKAYSYERRCYAARHNNWQGSTKAKELYDTLPTYNRTIQEIGYTHLVKNDDILGDFYGTNNYLSDECKMYNAKLIYDYLLSGSDRPIINDRPKRKGMVFDYPYLYY